MALTNVREFTLGLEEWHAETEEVIRQRTKAVALRALTGVVFGTRVDTGRARGNWQVQGGAPPRGHDPNAYHPTGEGVPGGHARDSVTEGQRVILEETSGAHTIWLHNGVPYILVLEGRDRMVEVTVEALRTWLQSQGGET